MKTLNQLEFVFSPNLSSENMLWPPMSTACK